MIEKILDKYYTKKLINWIKEDIILYNLDFKFTKDKNSNRIYIKCKKRKYKEECYTNIGNIFISDSLFTIFNYDLYIKDLKEKIEKYL